MKPNHRRSRLAAATAMALGASVPASAVYLNPDGLGQALIYPYYTVRATAGGNAFNTYLSVVNTTTYAKAVRVRVRESRMAREVLDFNLFLSANDVWTAAIIPTAGIATSAGDGVRLVTADNSCTDPEFGQAGAVRVIDFTTGHLDDGYGDGGDRLREGYVEMIEMATLTGASATAITQRSDGLPANCGMVRAPAFVPGVAAPTGGLSGTLTLINVTAGHDSTLNATALADLASRPFYRRPNDAYVDFDAVEIDPVSTVVQTQSYWPPPRPTYVYRSVFARPQDAVSAVLMSVRWTLDAVIDPEAASATDVVVTLPTKRFYVTPGGTSQPFSSYAAGWAPACTRPDGSVVGEFLGASYFDTAGRYDYGADGCEDNGWGLPCGKYPRICGATGVASVVAPGQAPDGQAHTTVLASTDLSLGVAGRLRPRERRSGWLYLVTTGLEALVHGLTSLPTSTRTDLATGQVTTGGHTFLGLPTIGFMVRTFSNGRLTCGGATCQGNYASAFPVRPTRIIFP